MLTLERPGPTEALPPPAPLRQLVPRRRRVAGALVAAGALLAVAVALAVLARPDRPVTLVATDFSAPGDRTLPAVDDGYVQLAPEGGWYRMRLLEAGHPAVYAGLERAELALDVEATVAVESAPDAATHGLACAAEGGDGYAFVRTPKGRFALDRYDDGAIVQRLAVGEITVDAIMPPHVLRLRCENRPASGTTAVTAWLDGDRVAWAIDHSGALAFRYAGFVVDAPGPASYGVDDFTVRVP